VYWSRYYGILAGSVVWVIVLFDRSDADHDNWLPFSSAKLEAETFVDATMLATLTLGVVLPYWAHTEGSQRARWLMMPKMLRVNVIAIFILINLYWGVVFCYFVTVTDDHYSALITVTANSTGIRPGHSECESLPLLTLGITKVALCLGFQAWSMTRSRWVRKYFLCQPDIDTEFDEEVSSLGMGLGQDEETSLIDMWDMNEYVGSEEDFRDHAEDLDWLTAQGLNMMMRESSFLSPGNDWHSHRPKVSLRLFRKMSDTMLSFSQRALKMSTKVDKVRQAEKALEKARTASMGADLGDVRSVFYGNYAWMWFTATFCSMGYQMKQVPTGFGDYYIENIHYMGHVRTSQLCQLTNAATEHGYIVFFFTLMFIIVYLIVKYTQLMHSAKNCWEFQYDAQKTFPLAHKKMAEAEREWEKKGIRVKEALERNGLIQLHDEFEDALTMGDTSGPGTAGGGLHFAASAQVILQSLAGTGGENSFDDALDFDLQTHDEMSFMSIVEGQNDTTDLSASNFDDADTGQDFEWGASVERQW